MKYVIPFVDPNNWQHSDNCIHCRHIDKLINKILIMQSDGKDATSIINSLETYLIDGYKVLQTYEMNGYIVLKPDKIAGLYTLKNVNEDVLDKFNSYLSGTSFSNILGDDITVFYSRWCSHCGKRKPDIYDTNRTERIDLLPITNFFVDIDEKDDGAYASIIWRDSLIKTYYRSVLIINDVPIIESFTKNEYEEQPYIIKIDDNQLIEIYIATYDKYGELLLTSDRKYIVHESINKQTIDPIIGLSAWQEVRLINIDNQYIQKNCIVTNYHPTTDHTIVRMATNGIPVDTNFGLPCDSPQAVDNNDTQLWYIKPFPVSKRYAKNVASGIQRYYDYNFNSPYILLQLTPLVDDVANVSMTNGSKQISLKWIDPDSLYWQKTIVMIRPYNGLPIASVHEGEIVYESFIKNQHSVNAYDLKGLFNGRKYQVGVFPVTVDGLVVVNNNQFVAEPKYIHDPITWHQFYELSFMHHFYWDKDKLTTHQYTAAWLECDYPLIEGGILTLKVKSDRLVRLNIYLNEYNIFNEVFSECKDFRWQSINIDIPIADYCKIVFEVSSKYSYFNFSMKDINFIYKEGVYIDN